MYKFIFLILLLSCSKPEKENSLKYMIDIPNVTNQIKFEDNSILTIKRYDDGMLYVVYEFSLPDNSLHYNWAFIPRNKIYESLQKARSIMCFNDENKFINVKGVDYEIKFIGNIVNNLQMVKFEYENECKVEILLDMERNVIHEVKGPCVCKEVIK